MIDYYYILCFRKIGMEYVPESTIQLSFLNIWTYIYSQVYLFICILIDQYIYNWDIFVLMYQETFAICTQRNIIEIVLNQTEIRFHLPFFD